MTVEELISEQGMAKRYREYSSAVVNKYIFLERNGRVPLKSMLNLSIRRVDLVNFTCCGL